MTFGIRGRLIFITVGILFFAIGATTFTNTYIFSKRNSDLHKSRASVIGRTLKFRLDSLLSLGLPLDNLVGFEQQCKNIVSEYDDIAYAMIVDKGGRIIFHNDPSMHNVILREPEILKAVARPEESVHFNSEGGTDYYDVVIPVFGNHKDHIAALRIGFPAEIVSRQSKEMIVYSIVIAVVSLGLVIVFVVAPITTWFTRPIKNLVKVMEEIREKRTAITNRAEITSEDEIGRLGLVFNEMLNEIASYHNALELKVEERTAQLEEANAKLKQDIERRRRTEEALARRSRELTRSNSELEQFAYIASHDLQEPLRKVTVFGDRLESGYAGVLGDKGLDYLSRMRDAARRMQSLIDDLLTFSRVTTKARAFVPTDLSETVKEVLSDLEVRIEQVKGRVDAGDLPTIEADPLQMRQLLQNLIGNALKFSKKDEPPVVKVHGSFSKGKVHAKGDDYYQLTVEDNGIGFDEQHVERIFKVFQRLHDRSEYEGTGIGLSVCRKIVERHGGSINAKSMSGEGATFTVMLPVKHEPGG